MLDQLTNGNKLFDVAQSFYDILCVTDWLPFVCYNQVKRLWNLIGSCKEKQSLPARYGQQFTYLFICGETTGLMLAATVSAELTGQTDTPYLSLASLKANLSNFSGFSCQFHPCCSVRLLGGSCETGQLSAVYFPCNRYSLATPIYAGWCICLLGLRILTNAPPPFHNFCLHRCCLPFAFRALFVFFFLLCSAFFQALRDEEVTDQREPTHSALWYHQSSSESIIRISAMCMCDVVCFYWSLIKFQ